MLYSFYRLFIAVVLTHEWLHFIEFERMKRMDFIIGSLLVPIVVSFLTTALIHFVFDNHGNSLSNQGIIQTQKTTVEATETSTETIIFPMP